MSTDSTNVVQIFGYFQDKRFAKALEHLACAYEANLAAEQEILEALILIGWDDENGTDEEKAYCILLKRKAKELKSLGVHIRTIMRSISGYEDKEGSSD